MRLPELQRLFVASLHGEPVDLRDAIRGDGGIGVADRLGIYRNNLRTGFAKTLALEFPVIAALCGAEFFAALAREFQDAHPSISGDLHGIGEPFPRYLRQRFDGGEYAYFADVAALEWAREQSARAADAAAPDLQAFAALGPDEAPAVRLPLHPSVRLITSRWPLFTIWKAHQGPGEVPHIDLGAGPEQVLVRRACDRIVLERIPAADHALLAALQGGEPLGAAFDAARAIDPRFDAATALRRYAGLLVSSGG